MTKPRLAIAYDFDGTLAPGNIQEHQFIPDIGMKKKDFWKEVDKIAKDKQADENLVYMYLMLKKAKNAEVKVRKKDFKDKGKTIPLFEGVKTWFNRINKYAKEKNVIIEHYIISSGNSELIAGTSIAKYFKKIFASSYLFDHHGIASWPALMVNYTNKTQFLFRINKGVLNVHDKKGVNKFIPDEERPIPFKNIVFIGDGETDIPCFRLVSEKGGLSIAIYKPKSSKAKLTAKQLKRDGRVNCYFSANYSQGKPLEKTIISKIDEVAARHSFQKQIGS